ncbi:MAG: hypothetical protein INH41_16860 [Myxococcaceae bacterium]|jgi:hypothetical protein|nr:hypothetical protein [Myxococcaceae bacterium]MCA3014054.1 hypothetical protein [Myxococcaceae bacterium]
MPGRSRRAAWATVVMLALCVSSVGCTPPPPTTPLPPPAPRAFLALPGSTTVIAPTIRGQITTSGCRKVGGLELRESNNFVRAIPYTGEPTSFELTPGEMQFQGLYNARGLALPLTLTAKVTCEEVDTFADGGFRAREGTSQPVSITFLPVQSVRPGPEGSMALPDSFVAEGGVAGQPTTFVGCVGTSTGTALLRVDQNGAGRAVNMALNPPCRFGTVVTAANRTVDVRWVWTAGVGAAAVDGQLNVTSTVLGPIRRLAVAPDGDAIAWLDEESGARSEVIRIAARPAPMANPIRWTTFGPFSTGYPGIMNADPVISQGRVYTSSWQYNQGTAVGRVVVLQYDYATGMVANNPPPAVITQRFAQPLNRPITPVGQFSVDGTRLYLPLLAVDTQGQLSTTVVSCTSAVAGCETGNGRRWSSPALLGELTTVLTFSSGNLLALVGPFATWFFNEADGAILNLANPQAPPQPLRPSGNLYTQGVVVGKATDFYVLNAPLPATEGQATFPTEVVALDHPRTGEVWRLTIEGGTFPGDSLYLAVDDNGQAWLRVGIDQVRPLGLATYRNQRGATTPP